MIAELEQTVERTLFTDFREAGEALAEIRDGRLYREDFGSFAAYVEGRFSIHRTTAYGLIQAATVAADLESARADIRLPARHAQLLYRFSSNERLRVARKIEGMSYREAARFVIDQAVPEQASSGGNRASHYRLECVERVSEALSALLAIEQSDVRAALSWLDPNASDKFKADLGRAARHLKALDVMK